VSVYAELDEPTGLFQVRSRCRPLDQDLDDADAEIVQRGRATRDLIGQFLQGFGLAVVHDGQRPFLDPLVVVESVEILHRPQKVGPAVLG